MNKKKKKVTTYLAGHEEADREGNGRGIMRQAFAVHRSHCQIYSRYRRFRLTTRFLPFFLLADVGGLRLAGASVVRPTRTMTGERRWKKTKVTIRPSEPGDNSRAEKEKRKNLNVKAKIK